MTLEKNSFSLVHWIAWLEKKKIIKLLRQSWWSKSTQRIKLWNILKKNIVCYFKCIGYLKHWNESCNVALFCFPYTLRSNFVPLYEHLMFAPWYRYLRSTIYYETVLLNLFAIAAHSTLCQALSSIVYLFILVYFFQIFNHLFLKNLDLFLSFSYLQISQHT